MTKKVEPVVAEQHLGDPTAVGTSFVKGTGSTEEGGTVGVGGGVNLIFVDNRSTASVGKAARVNQRSPGAGASTAEQDAWVEADTTLITLNLGNQASVLNLSSLGAGAAVGVGGSVQYVGSTNAAKAFVDDAALVSAGRHPSPRRWRPTADGSVRADADGILDNLRVAGAVAGGKQAGVGVGLTVNTVPGRQVRAVVGDEAVVVGLRSGGGVGDPQTGARSPGVSVDARAADDHLLFAAAGAASPGPLGAAGSILVNLATDHTVEARIGAGAQVNQAGTPAAAQDVVVTAAHTIGVLSTAGAVAGGGTAGFGAAVVTKTIDRDVLATLDKSAAVRAARHLTVDAQGTLGLTAVAVAAAGSKGTAGAGSVLVPTLATDTLAAAGDGAKLSAGAIRVTADADTRTNPVAGADGAGSGRPTPRSWEPTPPGPASAGRPP